VYGQRGLTASRRVVVAQAGGKIYNPVQNDWIVFRKTAQDTGGKLLSAELVVSPGGDEQRNLAEGGEAVVPPRTPHRLWNDTDEEARVLVELRPALNSEIFFETVYGLARDGKTDEKGAASILQPASCN
jgi:hypothetical protein